MAIYPSSLNVYDSAPTVAIPGLTYMDIVLAQFCPGPSRQIYDIIRAEVLGHKNFRRWPASVTKHHVYEGGLAVHTSEVLQYALTAAGWPDSDEEMPLCNYTVLAVGAIMHDFCKIWDYGKDESGSTWVEMPYRKLVRHVSGSHAEFVRLFAGTGLFTEEDYINIEHCILSHHGRYEHGSPVEPQTIEALLLHQADMLSAKFSPRRFRH